MNETMLTLFVSDVVWCETKMTFSLLVKPITLCLSESSESMLKDELIKYYLKQFKNPNSNKL